MALHGKRVLVTGGAGFLGQFVCREFERRGVGELVVPRSRDCDLTDAAATDALMRAVSPDVVVHLAAEVGGIGANRANPGRYFYANMAMALNVIETARLVGVEKFVQLGSICAYPKHTPVPFCESALWSGYPEETNAPYGIAKKAALVMLQGYRAQYDFPGIYLLPVNLYGPGDNFDLESSHVIPALIRKFATAVAAKRDSVRLWGTGSASREFLYVEDCARAIVAATAGYDSSEPVNIGTGREIRIKRLAELIAAMVGFRGRIDWDAGMPDGQPRRCLDTSAAGAAFGFAAEVDLEDGLERTVRWWLDQPADVAADRGSLASQSSAK
ncbi:MAG: GDP-L-fucose synthase [bacterium]|nr:GDP-L-fucose synthase [bacterium]